MSNHQREVPMVHSLLIITPKMVKEHEIFKCQLKVLLEYHRNCARETEKLVRKLEKCKETIPLKSIDEIIHKRKQAQLK